MSTLNVNNYKLASLPDDPIQMQTYRLQNGMTLYMSVNPSEARIYTNIVVRSGSKQDPADTTGLAHYMEHMLFKGTSKIGTVDWEKEKALLEKISDLFEQHRATEDAEERAKIYQQIDQFSAEAAKYIAPNEYDRLTSAIGAKATNAYTWVDQTVYVNDIPANELSRWMELESERFRMMALRLFHTELETVYEEFNISQDKDFRKANNAIRSALFPHHPYGTQTTIGSPQHLKNPSHLKIQEYFKTYYVPNNMGIMLAGDFDPQEAVALAEQFFGNYQASELPPFKSKTPEKLDQPIVREVYGQEAPYIELAWRLEGSQTDDPFMASFIRHLLYNQQAGLLDTHLNQAQKVLDSEAWVWTYQDYSVLGLYGKARNGQSLDEVKDLLLQQIENLKEGAFEDWLMEAVINELKLYDIKATESNHARINAMTNTFILGVSWEKYVRRIEWLSQLSKEDVTAFAKNKLHAGHVVLYKRQGEDPNVIKVEKPPISPVQLNRKLSSEYARQFLAKKTTPLKPVFVDFEEKIQREKLQSGIELAYVYNGLNSLFRLDFIFDMGKNSSKELSIALLYLPYLGTSKYSPSEFQQELFRLGLALDISCYEDRAYLTISGLEENIWQGVQLLEHLIQDVQADETILENIISDILVKRTNAKQNRNYILRTAMLNYARYGAMSAFTDRFSEEQLKKLTAEQLCTLIKKLFRFEHRIYANVQLPQNTVVAKLNELHRVTAKPHAPLPNKSYEQLPTEQDEVLFLDFPIVQVDVLMSSRITSQFDLDIYCMRDLFNEYFGMGLSSIVFQEIRESRAFAYSTYAVLTAPRKQSQGHFFQAYLGTQPDKLRDAVGSMQEIIRQMPVAKAQIENARHSILRKMESERLTDRKIFWEAQAVKELGFSHDLAQDVYQRLQHTTADELFAFYQQHIQQRPFTYLILGDQKRLDMSYIQSLGTFKRLSLEDVFGY